MLTVLALLVLVALFTIVDAAGKSLPRIEGIDLSERQIQSSADGKLQSLIVGVPEGLDPAVPTPLLVGIHTWSADYRQMVPQFAPLCARYGWLMVLPDFRGPNLTTNACCAEACASLLAQRDVVDVVEHMENAFSIDQTRRYLIGGSGGGHMSLMMAGKYPELWAGVSAWCPVSDLRDWHAQGNAYAQHVVACCGGEPGASVEIDFEYLRRSPRTFLINAANTNVQISHGDKDPTISVTQTWQTYETLRPIRHRTEFSSWTGGHDLLPEQGFAWLSRQIKPATQPTEQHLATDEAKWFFWLYLEPSSPLTLARCEAVLEDDSVLRVTMEACATARIRLAGLNLPAPTAVLRDGQPVACSVEAGCLELPGGDKTAYTIIFGAQA